jgi:hypothetical protein
MVLPGGDGGKLTKRNEKNGLRPNLLCASPFIGTMIICVGEAPPRGLIAYVPNIFGFPGGKRAFATTPTSTPPATESRCLPVCHPATDARIGLVGQGDADCGPVTVSLSPAIDCHAQRARQDALMPSQAWRETAG